MQLVYNTHPSPFSEDALFSILPGAVVPFASVPFKSAYSVPFQSAYVVFHLTVSLALTVRLTVISSQPHTPYFSQKHSTGYLVAELLGVNAFFSAGRVRLR